MHVICHGITINNKDRLASRDKYALSLFIGIHAPPPPSRLVYHWSSAPWDSIRGALKSALTDWTPSAYASASAAADALDEIISGVLKKYVKTSTPGRSRKCPWWDRHCVYAFKRKQQAFIRVSSRPELYAQACQVLVRKDRAAYAKYRSQLADALQGSCDARWWKTVKDHAGATSQRTSAAPSAEGLAEFFSKKLSVSDDGDDVPQLPEVTPRPFRTFRISSRQVHKVLRELDANKSANGISPRVLKICAGVLTLPITRLFRQIARASEWPSAWKLGRVSPIWKRKSKSDPGNYRPVTVLNNLSLVFERVTCPQVTNFLMPDIPDTQFGFRKRCGTDDYSVAMSSTLHLALEKGQEAIVVALDVAGAFDKVWWKALLALFENAGMSGRVLALMQSYLSARMLYVVAMGAESACKPATAGVPQGSIWSPFFWNFYIQELPVGVGRALVFGYADDTTLVLTFDPCNRVVAVNELNASLASINHFGVRYKVAFEPTKTHAMLVSNTRDQAVFPSVSRLEFDGVKIGFEDHLKIVGVVYDNKLTWSNMIDYVAAKGRKALGSLYKLRTLLGDVHLAAVYRSFIRSKMECGCLSYYGAARTHLEKLDIIQRRASRLSGSSFQLLDDRRDAACFGLLCKMLDGSCIPSLVDFCPELSA